MPDLPDLSGRVAMVVGAEFAAGGATALALAEAGADVAVCTVQADERVLESRKVKRAIEGMGRRSAEYVMDVMLGRNVQVTTRQIAKEMGGLDIVVSAGELELTAPLLQMSEMELARVVALNFSSHLFVIRSAAAEFRRNDAGPHGRGLVLLLTRAMGAHAANQSAFYAAQAGAQQLVRETSAELADAGVRVNALALGADATRVPSVALRLTQTDDTGMVVAVG